MDLAQADLVKPLLDYGPIGVIAALAITAVVVMWRRETTALDRARAENAELRQEIKELNNDLRRYLLMIPRASDTVSEALDVMRRMP